MNIFKKSVVVFSVIISVGGCQQHTRESSYAKSQTSPYLLGGVYHSSVNSSLPTNPKILQMQHEEKLAKIEAQKAKEIKELELQKTLNAKTLQERTQEIKAQSELELAKEKRKYAQLIAQSQENLKKIEAGIAQEKALAQKTIVQMQTQSNQSIEKLRVELSQKLAFLEAKLTKRRLWIILGALSLILIFWFIIYRYKREAELREKKEEMLHQERLLQQRQQQEQIEKVLDIIASNQTDKEVKVELARLLQNGISQEDPKLIEYKPKEDKED